MLISEVYVRVLLPDARGAFTDVETWRTLAIWTFPICVLLLFLMGVIAWGAALFWTDLLYHPPEIRKEKSAEAEKTMIKSQEKTEEENKLDVLDLDKLHALQNTFINTFNFEEAAKQCLKNYGVPSRKVMVGDNVRFHEKSYQRK